MPIVLKTERLQAVEKERSVSGTILPFSQIDDCRLEKIDATPVPESSTLMGFSLTSQTLSVPQYAAHRGKGLETWDHCT